MAITSKQNKITNFSFDFSKAIYRNTRKWKNLTLHCMCVRQNQTTDIDLSHEGEYVSWEFLSLVNPELCEEIKEAAHQHYQGIIDGEITTEPEIEETLLD